MPLRPALRIVALLLAGAGYVLACQWLMTHAQDSSWSVVGVLSPMLVGIAVGAWRAGQRPLGALAALAVAGLVAQALLGLRLPQQWLYLAQHVGVNLFLAAGFGATLRAGRTPLITALARRLHRRFTPAMAAYTVRLTAAWTIYFAAMALLSVVLFLSAPFAAWAWFANVLTPLSVGLMFVGEYLLRYHWHPEFERASFADAIRAYRHGAAE